jgi:hypothetical protein
MARDYRFITDDEAVALAELHALPPAEIVKEMEARGFEPRTSTQYRDALRKNKKVRALLFGEEGAVADRVSAKLRNVEGELVGTVKANRPRSVEEMADLFDIDENVYRAHDVITNQWANFWQTKVFWKRDEQQWILSEEWENLLGLIRAQSPRATLPAYPSTGIMHLIEILDAHLGMMSWAPETGNDWDLNLALQEYKRAFYALLLETPKDCERIVVRFGDDLLHYDKLIDGKVPTTFKGTPQDIDSRYPKLYSAVAHMLMDLVLEALRMAPRVDVVMVPGNHDKQSVFTLGELLDARFCNDDRVTVDKEAKEFKTYRWGANLLGFHHGTGGDREFKALPDVLKQKARKAWGECHYVEIHTGDKHHEFSLDNRMVLCRKLKALCPNDAWHTEQHYDSYRGAQCFSFRKSPGIWRQSYYHSSFMFKAEGPLEPKLGEE